MKTYSILLSALAALTLTLLLAGLTQRPAGLALLGFQLPALWTLLALVGIFRGSRSGQPVPVGFYVALGLALVSFGYFAVVFSAGRAGQ